MKTLLIVSGEPRGPNVPRNIKKLEEYADCRATLSTWWRCRSDLEDCLRDWDHFSCYVPHEPEINYHPGHEFVGPIPKNYQRFISNGMARNERWRHRTKQILIHAMYLEKMGKMRDEYDVVVRARFDTFLDDTALSPEDFREFIEEAHREKKSIGFFIPKGQLDQHRGRLNRLPPEHERRLQHLPDHLIIHPNEHFDTELVARLHHEKRLIAAEWGWYQVLSEPHGSKHESVLGFATVDPEAL